MPSDIFRALPGVDAGKTARKYLLLSGHQPFIVFETDSQNNLHA